jgi:hypothetical protein
VGAVEGHQTNLTQPFSQWRKPLTSGRWAKYPRISSEIEKRPMTSSKKYGAIYASTLTLVASTRQRRKQPSPLHV